MLPMQGMRALAGWLHPTTLCLQYYTTTEPCSGHQRSNRLAAAQQQPRRHFHCAHSHSRSAPTAEQSEAPPYEGGPSDDGQAEHEGQPGGQAEQANGVPRHHAAAADDAQASQGHDLKAGQAQEDQSHTENGATATTPTSSSTAADHQQAPLSTPQGTESPQSDWQPDWDRFEPFASISSSADSVDLAEEPAPAPQPSEHSPR